MKLSKAIFRVFEVRARPGHAKTLERKLSETSVSVVAGEPGNLGHFFGTTLSSDGNDLVFVSVWQDMDAIKARFGESWEESYLPEGYEALIESCSVRHIVVDGALNS